MLPSRIRNCIIHAGGVLKCSMGAGIVMFRTLSNPSNLEIIHSCHCCMPFTSERAAYLIYALKRVFIKALRF